MRLCLWNYNIHVATDNFPTTFLPSAFTACCPKERGEERGLLILLVHYHPFDFISPMLWLMICLVPQAQWSPVFLFPCGDSSMQCAHRRELARGYQGPLSWFMGLEPSGGNPPSYSDGQVNCCLVEVGSCPSSSLLYFPPSK